MIEFTDAAIPADIVPIVAKCLLAQAGIAVCDCDCQCNCYKFESIGFDVNKTEIRANGKIFRLVNLAYEALQTGISPARNSPTSPTSPTSPKTLHR